MSDDSANIKGRGREILLPPEGNPFDKSPATRAAMMGKAGRPAVPDESQDFSPADFGDMDDEVKDLTPDDIAARFPSSHDDRNVIPGGAADEPAIAPPIMRKGANPFGAPVETTPTGTTYSAPAADVLVPAPAPMPEMAVSSFMAPPPPPADSAPALMSAPQAASLVPAPTGFQAVNPFSRAPSASPSARFGIAQPSSGGDSPDLLDESDTAQPLTGDFPLPPVEEDEAMVKKIVTYQRIEELWARIEAAENLAVLDANSLPAQRIANLENVKAARNLLLGGRKNYEDASRYVAEVESDLFYVERVRGWSYTYGLLVLLYNIVWLVMLVIGFSAGHSVATRFGGTGIFTTEFTLTVWVTILSGGLGGVAKSIYSLGTHISKQDFDRQHMMWYITSPLMGAVMGVFVVMVAQVGLVTLSGGQSASGTAVFILYILAWLAGFNQNVALQLVEQAIKFVFKPEEKEKAKAEATQPPAVEAPEQRGGAQK